MIMEAQQSIVNWLSPVYVPWVETSETTASTVYGIMDADGMFNITSLVTVTVEVATPSTPFASVYATETGIIISALTLAARSLSGIGSIIRLLIVPSETVLFALIKVNGYVGLLGVKLVMLRTISVSCVCCMHASKTFLACKQTFSHKPFNGLPVIGPGHLSDWKLQKNDIFFLLFMLFYNKYMQVPPPNDTDSDKIEKNVLPFYFHKSIIQEVGNLLARVYDFAVFHRAPRITESKPQSDDNRDRNLLRQGRRYTIRENSNKHPTSRNPEIIKWTY